MRGPTPEPAAIKQAKGNPGHRPIGEPAAAVTLRGAAAPDWLSADAREIWNEIAPELGKLKLLQGPDEQPFARYCEWFAKWRKAMVAVEQLVVVTDSEHVKNMQRIDKHLHVALLIEKRLLDAEDRFGLNPANRQRIFAIRAQGGQAPTIPGELPLDDPDDAPRAGPIGFLGPVAGHA